MADDNSKFDLTRRKALAGLGGIGAGAALGGTGTMAFLNDTESVEGNTMTAGTLDLKLDWQQQSYGSSAPGSTSTRTRTTDGDGEQSI
ncbi:SipW-dependent-type signal peptide-containing protein, partial [Halolamina rubra]|uniref:SipW-dependent-type signal peptide-containing protein n=1 Tax=Halolamina rubra TaxID=1380430 RepID=UPI001F1C06E6